MKIWNKKEGTWLEIGEGIVFARQEGDKKVKKKQKLLKERVMRYHSQLDEKMSWVMGAIDKPPEFKYTTESRRRYKKKKRERLQQLKQERGCACGVRALWVLTIHHIDGNSRNNQPENLEVVCLNCHASRHLKRSLGGMEISGEKEKEQEKGEEGGCKNTKWVYDSSQLTPRDEIPRWW